MSLRKDEQRTNKKYRLEKIKILVYKNETNERFKIVRTNLNNDRFFLLNKQFFGTNFLKTIVFTERAFLTERNKFKMNVNFVVERNNFLWTIILKKDEMGP